MMDLNASAAAFTIATQRLHIRPLSRRDEDIYCFLYTDEEMMRHVGKPLQMERAQRSFRKAVEFSSRRPLAQLFLAILHNESGEAVGVCSIQQIDLRREAAEVGIMLKRAARGQSFATEALTALIDAAFDRVGVEAVWAETPETHAAAAGLFRRLRFSLTPGGAGDAGGPGRCIWSMTRACWRNTLPTQSGGT